MSKDEVTAYVPKLLSQPIAADLDLQKAPPVPVVADTKEPIAKGDTTPRDTVKTVVNEKDEATEATKKPTVAPSSGVPGTGPAESAMSAATTQIMNILNNYPLSRLGSATTAVSTSVATASHSSPSHDAGAKSKASEGIKGQFEQLPIASLYEAAQSRKVSLGTVIMVAIIFFLLGSLVRSLQSPADFILLPPSTAHLDTADAVAAELRRFLANVNAGASGVALREIKRLIEFKKVIFGRDLVIAVVQRE